jgi:hypothetical protein
MKFLSRSLEVRIFVTARHGIVYNIYSLEVSQNTLPQSNKTGFLFRHK